MRVDHRPLAQPVVADALAAMDVTTFHTIRPEHARVHGGKHRLHVTGIEPIIETLK